MTILDRIFRQLNSTPKTKTPRSKTTTTQTSRTLQIQGYDIPVKIIHSSRSRYIRISHSPGHDIRITVPQRISDTAISLFIQQHESWILQQHLTKSDSIIDSNPDLCDHSREHYLTYKQSALDFCTSKVEQRNQSLGWNYNKITVKSLKTKRGSCSSKGNLNFNYKLMFLPEPMADYIIVHELCHLHQMNHGPKFWKLIEEVYGPEWEQYKTIR